MARKTFISYKYSESKNLRDRIVEAMGDDAIFYKGETADSPDLTDLTAETIKNNLKNMMFNTSVTIVVLSPNMTQSKWIDWEIEYTLKEIERDGRASGCNGVICVISKVNGSYDWLVTENTSNDNCKVVNHKSEKLYEIINKNRYNRKKSSHLCSSCRTYDRLKDSYISLIKEDDFLNDINTYIENAFDKSQRLDEFEIVKQVD